MADGFSHYVVKRSSPLRARLAWLVLALVVCTALWLVYTYGQRRGGYDASEAQRQIAMLELRVAQFKQENGALREKAARLENAALVDRHAYSDVEADLRALQGEIYDLKKQLGFYQRVVAADTDREGPRIEDIKLMSVEGQPGHYRYRLTLVQAAKRGKAVKGAVQLRIDGMSDGRPKALTLKTLSGGKTESLLFAFKYFQNLDGEFLLPEGFEPGFLWVQLQVKGKGSNEEGSERLMPWSELIP
jgi:hypothetical protein